MASRPTQPPVQWVLWFGRVKVKVEFILEKTTKAQRGSRGIVYSFFNLGARWGGLATPRPGPFTPGKDPVPIV
jgi:hypothetical protein